MCHLCRAISNSKGALLGLFVWGGPTAHPSTLVLAGVVQCAPHLASPYLRDGHLGDIYAVESLPECWDQLGPPVPILSLACALGGLAFLVPQGPLWASVVSMGAQLEELDRVLPLPHA